VYVDDKRLACFFCLGRTVPFEVRKMEFVKSFREALEEKLVTPAYRVYGLSLIQVIHKKLDEFNSLSTSLLTKLQKRQ